MCCVKWTGNKVMFGSQSHPTGVNSLFVFSDGLKLDPTKITKLNDQNLPYPPSLNPLSLNLQSVWSETSWILRFEEEYRSCPRNGTILFQSLNVPAFNEIYTNGVPKHEPNN